MKILSRLPIATGAALIIGVGNIHAALLSVDFGTGGGSPEPGFLGQTALSQTHSTANGDVTVTLSGTQGLIFDYASTTGTNTALYRDFFFNNGSSFSMDLSGPGIQASSEYIVTFWSYYGGEANGRETKLVATGTTTGTTLGPINFSDSPPDALYDYVAEGSGDIYTATGNFISDPSGALTFSVESDENRPLINGIEITPVSAPVPEPSSFVLGLAGLALLLRRRV